MSLTARFRTGLLVLLVATIVTETASAASRLDGAPVPDSARLDIFVSSSVGQGGCGAAVTEWLEAMQPTIKLGCSTRPYLSLDKALRSLGGGVHPYLRLSSIGEPELRAIVAVPLPFGTYSGGDFSGARISAGKRRETIPIGGVERRPIGGRGNSVIFGFDVPSSLLSPELLRDVAAAKRRTLSVDGREQVTISGRQAKVISEMLRLYDALSSAPESP